MSKQALSDGHAHCFSASNKDKDLDFDIPTHWKVHDISSFKKWDTKGGIEIRRNDDAQTLVCRKLSRDEALKCRPQERMNQDYAAVLRLEASHDRKYGRNNITVRNAKNKTRRALHGRHTKPMYLCPGVKVQRGRPGVVNSRPEHIATEDWNALIDMIVSMEKATRPYLDPYMIRGIHKAKQSIGWKVMQPECIDEKSNKDSQQTDSPLIWQQAAFGRNVMLNSHTDQDFSLSCITVFWDKKTYTCSDEIVQYFVFPEDGIAVALRPGDILLFNPCVPHCASSRCESDLGDIVLASFYLKSALVGGNDEFGVTC